MKCVICKNGDRLKSTTNLSFDKDGAIVVFTEVPCLKCGQCGEVYLADEVSQILFKALEKISKNSGEVSIQKFNAA